ncbi:MAG: flavin reductase [Myxococcota bacterium]|jgi:flavin reductase (DIM6/NTAB) family NADH-FMN oxidoreductase RutF/predicted enzyme related to lactoylglutathione lyase|nr:flavin reductase [Myxococcota bacterium]
MSDYGKIEIGTNRLEWNPSPLTEQVVLVTTVNEKGEPHLATKSRVTVISYGPPAVVVFGCQARFQTAANVLKTSQFVLNIPGEDLVAMSWVVGMDPASTGSRLLAENGITPIPSLKVSPPRIAECRAHIECTVSDVREIGNDLAVFGTVVSASLNSNIAQGDAVERYQRLSPFFFLDFERTALLGIGRLVEQPPMGLRQMRTVLATSDLNRAADFYSGAFDWPALRTTGVSVDFMLPDGSVLRLLRAEAFGHALGSKPCQPQSDGLTGAQIHLSCEDLPRVIARLVALGARELWPLSEQEPGEESAAFADPDGNVVVVSRLC